MTLLDKWWYFNYRWHKWRLERNLRSATAHLHIIMGPLRVETLEFDAQGLDQIFKPPSSSDEETQEASGGKGSSL